jgi:very-short-patch-repair endonuclease
MFEVWTRAELVSSGASARQITDAVRDGRLIRARKGHYVSGDAPPALVTAARVGGRLGCISLLAALGVFTFDDAKVHIHMERGDSRMRGSTGPILAPVGDRDGVSLHWRRWLEAPGSGAVHIYDALLDAVRCQDARHAIATLDSAAHVGLITLAEIRDLFGVLPRRYGALAPLLDGRAESGPETLVRLMVRSLGHSVELQVTLEGVGRVDLLVDGWLVIECDSRQFHSSWDQQRTDYRRDRALAALGYSVLRLMAEDILYRPDLVVAALRGLLDSHRSGR